MTTYTYQPDETDGIDTFMKDIAPTTNYGTAGGLDIGDKTALGKGRTLIKFDFTKGTNPIPAYSQIVSATLTLTPITDNSHNARVLSVYRSLRAWTEAGATWNKYDGTSDWGTAGAANTTTDREAAAMGTANISGSQTLNVGVPITLNVSKVQDWINGTFANNGMVLQVATESDDQFVYGTSGNVTEAYRPKIVIEFIPHTFPKVIEF